jgi:hypothetical protein
MNQLGLLIGVGIAAAAGEGRPCGAIFVNRAKQSAPTVPNRVPLLCPSFFGARLQGINSLSH